MLQTISRMIAQYVTELISVTETIKGNNLHYLNIVSCHKICDNI